MSAYSVARFDAFLDDRHVRAVLARCRGAEERMRVVAGLRQGLTQSLQALALRVPTVPERIAAVYIERGKPVPTWNLDDDDQAAEFNLVAKKYAAPHEQRSLDLLRACIDAREAGDVLPFAELEQGTKMLAGRKSGTIGPVRAWVRKYMAKHPGAKTAEAWEALKARPPRGVTVCDNRLGRYIETTGARDTGYPYFATIVSEERPKK